MWCCSSQLVHLHFLLQSTCLILANVVEMKGTWVTSPGKHFTSRNSSAQSCLWLFGDGRTTAWHGSVIKIKQLRKQSWKTALASYWPWFTAITALEKGPPLSLDSERYNFTHSGSLQRIHHWHQSQTWDKGEISEWTIHLSCWVLNLHKLDFGERSSVGGYTEKANWNQTALFLLVSIKVRNAWGQWDNTMVIHLPCIWSIQFRSQYPRKSPKHARSDPWVQSQ